MTITRFCVRFFDGNTVVTLWKPKIVAQIKYQYKYRQKKWVVRQEETASKTYLLINRQAERKVTFVQSVRRKKVSFLLIHSLISFVFYCLCIIKLILKILYNFVSKKTKLYFFFFCQ